MNREKQFHEGRWRLARLSAWLGAGALFCVFVVLPAFSGMFAKFDDPTRLGVAVHLTTTNGFTLRWAEKPAAADARLNLVFIHGSPGGAGVWASQFKTPFPDANLFAYDRPGFGQSKPVWREPHLEGQVDALMTLLTGAANKRVLLVGHSYGSPIALLAALEYPDRIGGVLLIGGNVDPPWKNRGLSNIFFAGAPLPGCCREHCASAVARCFRFAPTSPSCSPSSQG